MTIEHILVHSALITIWKTINWAQLGLVLVASLTIAGSDQSLTHLH
jgi:hypothetical protein